MIQIILDDIKPLSENQAYAIFKKGSIARRIKTKKARDFESTIHKLLLNYKKHLDWLLDNSNEGLLVEYKIYNQKVIKKNGGISKTFLDVDNIKLLQDNIFSFFGVNDAYIMKVSSEKIQSSKNYIEVNISIYSQK